MHMKLWIEGNSYVCSTYNFWTNGVARGWGASGRYATNSTNGKVSRSLYSLVSGDIFSTDHLGTFPKVKVVCAEGITREEHVRSMYFLLVFFTQWYLRHTFSFPLRGKVVRAEGITSTRVTTWRTVTPKKQDLWYLLYIHTCSKTATTAN